MPDHFFVSLSVSPSPPRSGGRLPRSSPVTWRLLNLTAEKSAPNLLIILPEAWADLTGNDHPGQSYQLPLGNLRDTWNWDFFEVNYEYLRVAYFSGHRHLQ